MGTLLQKCLKKGPSGHGLANLGKCHVGLPPYAQDLVRCCSWEREDSEDSRKYKLCFSQVVGSQRGGVSLDSASRYSSRSVYERPGR